MSPRFKSTCVVAYGMLKTPRAVFTNIRSKGLSDWVWRASSPQASYWLIHIHRHTHIYIFKTKQRSLKEKKTTWKVNTNTHTITPTADKILSPKFLDDCHLVITWPLTTGLIWGVDPRCFLGPKGPCCLCSIRRKGQHQHEPDQTRDSQREGYNLQWHQNLSPAFCHLPAGQCTSDTQLNPITRCPQTGVFLSTSKMWITKQMLRVPGMPVP